MAERLIGYVRVSRVAGRDDLVSPEIQRKKIEDWATLHDAEIVRWYDEIDQPGSKLDRPMFQEALALCEGGQGTGSLCTGSTASPAPSCTACSASNG